MEYITPQKYENSIEIIFVEDIFQKILGLSQENYRIFDPIYITKNRQSCMTSGIIKIYPTAADVDTDTNPIAEYTITATYNNDAEMTSYKVKRTT